MRIYPAFFSIALVLAFSTPSLAEGFNKEQAKKLLEEKCSACHTLERTLERNKTKEGWESTVNRMRKKGGSGISEEEAKIITEYLALTQGTK